MEHLEYLEELLNENLERLEGNLWAAWLDDDKMYRDEQSVKGMIRNLNLKEIEEDLLNAQKAGLLRLVVDDRALIVGFL